jgi:hypothetical protein
MDCSVESYMENRLFCKYNSQRMQIRIMAKLWYLSEALHLFCKT